MFVSATVNANICLNVFIRMCCILTWRCCTSAHQTNLNNAVSSCYVCLLETLSDGLQSKSIPQILQKHSRTVPTVVPFKHTDGYVLSSSFSV